MKKIQSYVSIDSIPESSFETLVELYYQTKGYITASNKWFWYWEEGKKQRGYQDIDIIAIKKDESILIAVTSEIDKDQKEKLPEYFKRARKYLQIVSEYSWLTKKPFKLKKAIVYSIGSEHHINELKNQGYELISQREIIKGLVDYLNDYYKQGIKIKSSAMEILRAFRYYFIE